MKNRYICAAISLAIWHQSPLAAAPQNGNGAAQTVKRAAPVKPDSAVKPKSTATKPSPGKLAPGKPAPAKPASAEPKATIPSTKTVPQKPAAPTSAAENKAEVKAEPAIPKRQPEKARRTMMEALDEIVLRQDSGKARDLLNRALAEDPELVEAHYNLGLLAATDENWAEADARFAKVVALAPQSRWAKPAEEHRARARELASLDSTPAGRVSREVQAVLGLAEWQLSKGMLRKAVALAAEAAVLDDSQGAPYLVGARAHMALGDLSRCHNFLQEALKRLPEAERPKVQLVADSVGKELNYQNALAEGKGHLAEKRSAEAVAALTKANTLFPDRSEAALPLSSALGLAGEPGKARDVLKTFVDHSAPAISEKAKEHAAVLEIEQRRLAIGTEIAKELKTVSGEPGAPDYFVSMYNPPMRSIKDAIKGVFERSKIETKGDVVSLICVKPGAGYSEGEVLFSGTLGEQLESNGNMWRGAARKAIGSLTVRLTRDADYARKVIAELESIAPKAGITVKKGKKGTQEIVARIPFTVRHCAWVYREGTNTGLMINTAMVWTLEHDDPYYDFVVNLRYPLAHEEEFLLTKENWH